MNKRKGILFVVSAPSGAGKTTLCNEILKNFRDIRFSISCTTRKKRDGEVEGVDYHFINRTTFERMVKEGAFAEWAEVHGELYGTTISEIEKTEKEGIDLILDIDWQGAAQIKEKLKKGIYIFILPPSLPILEKRLKNRGKDSEESIIQRLENAKDEIKHANWYDYNVTNDDLKDAFVCMKSIIIAERCRQRK